MTATILIGNSDDKLTQVEWANFCDELSIIAKRFGTMYFEGTPPGHWRWQNACVVVSVGEDVIGELKQHLRDLCKIFDQESIAFIAGQTEFLKGGAA